MAYRKPVSGKRPGTQSGPRREKNNIEQKVGELLSEMTLDEKIDQMYGIRGLHCVTPFTYRLRWYGNRGVPRLGIPAFRFTDGPKGINLNRSTCFPVPMARGASFDPDLEERVGTAMGLEARHQGANATGSTCINIVRHPGWGRAQESFGADPFHMSVMGAAHVRGLKKNVMPVIKHYACNSIENTRFKVSVNISERTLREVYLPHFKACIDAGAAAVMTAYNRVNGTYCAENTHLLTDILKGEWGFDGFVISDWWFGCRSTVPSLRAGLDIEMPIAQYYRKSKIKKALAAGEVSESVIDDSVRRILRQLLRFDLFRKFPSDRKKVVACREHTDLALEVARKSMVLLKNERGFLPLDRSKVRRIAVVGECASRAVLGDVASSAVKPPWAVSPLEGIRKTAGPSVEVVFEPGKSPGKLAEAARWADAVVVVTSLTRGFKREEGERIKPFGGGDRAALELPAGQSRLIREAARANGNCVVVLQAGSAVCADEWIDEVPALLMAWYPGMQGGRAIAEVLFGDYNPGGKMPITVPKSTDQLPPLDTVSREVPYDGWHDYRYFDRRKLKPRFAFGFGLSYTTFRYRNLRIDKNSIGPRGTIKASVEVTNTGTAAGDEVVQWYVGRMGQGVPRPARELKGFKRIHLKPGQTKRVELSVPAASLGYYDEKTSRWFVEPARYRLYAGPSSREADLLAKEFRILKK